MTDTIDRPFPERADAGSSAGEEREVPTAAGPAGIRPGVVACVAVALVLVTATITAVITRGSAADPSDVRAGGVAPSTTAASASGSGHDHVMDHGAAPMDHHAMPMDHGASPMDHGASPATNVPGAGNPVSHDHGVGTYVPLDAATQHAFTAEMQTAREATIRYPTVADAKKAGLRAVGRFSAGSGAHYMVANPLGRLAFNPSDPLMWLFAGNDDTSPVVGLMYFSIAPVAPEGFTGPNDHWHQHTGLCLTYGPEGVGLPLPIDQDATPEQCAAVHGQFMASTGFMIHVWSAPGWESPKGVFSHDNELLVCADGRKAGEVQLNEGCDGMA
jgi:hypothetical protein